MNTETTKQTTRIPFKLWLKQGLFYWGSVEALALAYKFIGAMLVTYGYVESLPYVQLMNY